MSTLSFRNEKPTLIIHKNIHDLPFDSSGMELIAKSDNIASIQIDLNNLDLYKCILIDPREELLDFPTLRNHLIGVS